jgi:hypothetical protein
MNERTMYKLCIDSYTGVGGYLDGTYLQQFSREEDFEDRLANSYYENNIVGMVTSATAPVFGDNVQRSNMSQMYEAFTKNVDMRGTTLTNWLFNVAKLHTLLSNVFIIMDNVQKPVKNVSEAIDKRSFPYLTYKTPDLVEDVKISNTGEITSITFYLDSKNINGANTNVYRTISGGVIKDWYGSAKDPQYIGDPISAIGTRVIMTGSEPMPIPQFLSLCQIARAVYNMDSEQRDLERAQAFSILQVPSNMPETAQVIGAKNVLYVGEDASRDAKYISPDSNILQSLGLSSDRMTLRMKDQARNIGIRIVEKHYKSGDAIELDYEPSSTVYENNSILFEDVEKKINRMFIAMTGITDNTEIVYDQDYKPSDSKNNKDYTMLTEASATDYGEERNMQIRNESYKKLALITGMETLPPPPKIEPVVVDEVTE